MIKEPIMFSVPTFVSLSGLEHPFEMHIPGNFDKEEKALMRLLLKDKTLPFNETFTMAEDLRMEILSKYQEVCYKALHSDGVVGVLLVYSEEGILKDVSIQD